MIVLGITYTVLDRFLRPMVQSLNDATRSNYVYGQGSADDASYHWRVFWAYLYGYQIATTNVGQTKAGI